MILRSLIKSSGADTSARELPNWKLGSFSYCKKRGGDRIQSIAPLLSFSTNPWEPQAILLLEPRLYCISDHPN